jgi:hypothetical protein
MQRYDLGDAVSLRREPRDADGNIPTSVTVTFSVIKPSGQVYSPSVVPNPDIDGAYDVTVPGAEIDEYGPYEYTWDVTGDVTDVSTGQFYVGEPEESLPPLGSFERLSRKLGYTPAGDERDRAGHLLDEASELIRDVAGKTWTDPDTGALESVPRRVALICVAAAFRAFTNPEALSQRSIGDSSRSYDRNGVDGGDAVYLTPAEEKTIRSAAGASSLVTVTMVSPYSGDAVIDEEEIVFS